MNRKSVLVSACVLAGCLFLSGCALSNNPRPVITIVELPVTTVSNETTVTSKTSLRVSSKTSLRMSSKTTATFTSTIKKSTAKKSTTTKIGTTKAPTSRSTSAVTTVPSDAKKTGTTSTTVEPTTTTLPFACTVALTTPLPTKLNYAAYDGSVQSSCVLSAVDIEVLDQDLKLVFYGEKTFDRYGENGNDTCKIGWKLYDAQGVLVQRTVCYSQPIKTGERFSAVDMWLGHLENGGEYTLELCDVD